MAERQDLKMERRPRADQEAERVEQRDEADTNRGCRRTRVTSLSAGRTGFLVATSDRAAQLIVARTPIQLCLGWGFPAAALDDEGRLRL